MRWILDNFQLVALIVGAFIYWLQNFAGKKLAERKAAEREEQEPEQEEGEFDEFEAQEEYVEPPAEVPPPLPPPRLPAYQEVAAGEAGKHKRMPAARQQRTRETKADTTGGAAATRAKVSARDSGTVAAAPPARLRSRLRQPAEARRAVVMREILGPPAGLR